jgi:lysophospholipase L1-like esterase
MASRPVIELPVAYWAATEINIAHDSMIVLQQQFHWLVIIAEKITIGNNVTLTWEQRNLGVLKQEPTRSKKSTPPTSIYMSGTDGQNGRNGKKGGAGRPGDPGPEIEMWSLDINRLPSEVLLAGQSGSKGAKGQNGQDGQNGAKGKSWVAGSLPGTCKNGPGNGGKGGKGGVGGNGGTGGNGGHGGRFNVYAPSDVLTNISLQGYYPDFGGGLGGDGGDPGAGGKGGKGGKKGKDRSGVGCPTNFGKNGKNGTDGNDGEKGSDGTIGDNYLDASKYFPIDANEFIEAFSKPSITFLSPKIASVGDIVTINGKNISNTDKVYVNNVEAITNFVSDTLITFEVPNINNVRQNAVNIRQADGTISNNDSLFIRPEIIKLEQNGKSSTDRPTPRFEPGKSIDIIGTGFSDNLAIKVNDNYVEEENITHVDSNKVTFKLFRPSDVTPDESGENVTIQIILDDGIESNRVDIILDTIVIAVFGDSIQWGQGLREDLKFHSIVANQLSSGGEIGVYKVVHAHSGAVIGVGNNQTKEPVNGEVPTSYPTILQQLDLYDGTAANVDYVLIDGGINDIGVEEIVSPIATSNLKTLAKKHCYDDMKFLLRKVTENKFPNAKVIVTGYYPIVTDDSNLNSLILLLGGLGLLVGGLAGAIVGGAVSIAQKDIMVDRSKKFIQESMQQLKKAVDDTNTHLGGTPRVFFAQPNFTSKNAVFASESLLWGIEPDLGPADDEALGGVEQARHEACNLVVDDDSNRTSLTQCVRASIGHPNVNGAKEYARVICDQI